MIDYEAHSSFLIFDPTSYRFWAWDPLWEGMDNATQRRFRAKENTTPQDHQVHSMLVFTLIFSWNLHAKADKSIHHALQK